MSAPTRDEAIALDAADPLAPFRDRFQLNDRLIYLDGNSLGALPKSAIDRVAAAVRNEWGEGLITSWLGAEWVSAPQRIGNKIATLIGAGDGEVIVADSTSVNLFKALSAAVSLNPGRRVILSEATNFPTDVYMMQGIAGFGGGLEARTVAPDDVLDALDEDVAVLLLTQTHYKTGRIRDMAAVNAHAHASGALVIWDLSHSVGAFPVDLNGTSADFAVGCGYKFLNGGPGAPAFIFVAARHQPKAQPVLSGWFGHAQPFAFEETYRPAPGIDRFMCGTPPVLGLTALECGVDIMTEVDMAALREKSLRLGELFASHMAARCGDMGFTLASPADPAIRGSHVSYAHEHGYEIVQALKQAHVIGDFRAPDVLRFGLTPLYLRYRDVIDAVEAIHDVMRTRAWDKPEYRERATVT